MGNREIRILGLNGSPRGAESRTGRLVQAVLDGAAERGATAELIEIGDLEIDYCIGCSVCYATGECIHEDDFAWIFDKMLEADGIVMGSPNYVNGPTAQIKAMIDRMADAIHCQAFTGKYGCSVSTAGGSQADRVAAYLGEVLTILGATCVGAVDAVVGADISALDEAELRARALGARLADAIANGEVIPEQEAIHRAMRERMQYLVRAHGDEWQHQYDYWDQLGWDALR
jgi:multimeric flavodoxin WrbA